MPPPTDIESKLLLVDDLKENLVALDAPGAGLACACLRPARLGDAALALMLEHEFALALVDVQMPGMNGFERRADARPSARGTSRSSS